MLPRISDGSNEVANASEILFTGGTVTEPQDGVAQVTIGGGGGGGSGSGSGGGVGTSSGNSVTVLNNAAQDLNIGDVVVTDETADNAVTTTTTEGDTRIAGVVQEPIATGFFGKVLFNGYAARVNAPDAVRGEYAKTSTVAGVAASTADREAGSFAVFMTGVDFPDFVADAVTTTTDTPTTTLDIALPTAPIDRLLFLALWLDSNASSISLPDWTRVGSTSGYYYFYRVTDGADTATATWTGESVAVASVALLHESVALAVPVEDFAYEGTTSAASVAGLSDVAHYALAGVDADVATPGSGFTRIAGGSATYLGSGTPALIQSKHRGDGSAGTTVTFDSTITEGNVVLMVSAQIDATSCYSTDLRDPGTCPIDSHMTNLAGEYTHAASNGTVHIQGKTVTADTYSGPFGHKANCSLPAYEGLLGMEFSNATIAGAQTLQGYGTASAVDVGDFTAGGDDLLVMAVQWRATDGNNSFDPAISVNGFTQVWDGLMLNTEGGSGPVSWGWVGYKVGSGDASVTSTAAYADQHWAAVAVLLSGASAAAGTLAGKYIAHDAAVTSPFSGAGKEADAIFAVNMLRDARPAALLYGPDLFGQEAVCVSEPLILEDGTIAILENGHAAMSEPICP